MSKFSSVLKLIGCSFGAALAASLIVLFMGACLFGFQFNAWAGWQGRLQ